jgi:dynein heavy chain
MMNSFINKSIPANWVEFAYLSLKPLTSWFQDLLDRLEFMKNWLEEEPKSYWLSCFFFPQGFLTAVK